MNVPAEKSVPPPVIFLDAVHKIYRSGEVDVHAVRGVSLTIAKGEFVAIMGASGSGKSTLMNMIGCLDRPTKGSYLLDGAAVSELNRRQLSHVRNQKLGFVFQSFNLLARTTALENVELPMFYSHQFLSLRQQRGSALKALEKVGLTDRATHHPSQLSGGQQQRVALARALVNEPEVILADEPTGNLDSRTSIDIMGVFQALNDAGITIVMVTHELDIASFCKRIIIMRDGEIVSDEPNHKRHLAADDMASLNRREQRVKLL
jgi:putative ABC transport system ATP-binding protein